MQSHRESVLHGGREGGGKAQKMAEHPIHLPIQWMAH